MAQRSQNFWDFSVDLYARDRVANACLDLQTTCQVDVNVLLLCYWHGMYHGELSDETLSQALDISAHWNRQVVQPLRHVRKWMKEHPEGLPMGDRVEFETLRGRVKLDELAAEKIEQELLEQLCLMRLDTRPVNVGVSACEKNVALLLNRMGIQPNDLIAARLRLIGNALK